MSRNLHLLSEDTAPTLAPDDKIEVDGLLATDRSSFQATLPISPGGIAALAATALLAACGGTNPDDDSASVELPAAFRNPGAAVHRQDILLLPSHRADDLNAGEGARVGATLSRATRLSAQRYRVPTTSELLDYAERAYPQYFPTRQTNLEWEGIVYRFYPSTGNYVGVLSGDVLILGPFSGNVLTRVGSLQDFSSAVFAGRPVLAPTSDEDAARFLLHAQFSASIGQIAQVRTRGYEAWLDDQLALPNSQSGWDWLMEKGYSAIDVNEFFFAFGSNNYMIWYQLFQSPDAVRRRWALALSEIFVVSWRGIKDVMNWDNFAMAHYWDILCTNAFGNYRDLLEALTLSPAMGAFLSTRGNQKEDPATGRLPDENYAREVMQLFSIGLLQLNMDGSPRRDAQGKTIESYDAEDVSNLARVFTGYRLDDSGPYFTNPNPPHQRIHHLSTVRNRMVLDPNQHSPLQKRFLGVTIPSNTSGAESLRIALDTLFNHPNTAPFLSRQFIQRLVTSNPSPAYIERVASAFVNNGAGVRGDLRAVLKAVLLDDEARGAASLASSSFGKLREPMLRVAQWGRTFRLRSKLGRWKAAWGPWNPTRDLGQYPLDPPSVFNFFRPGYVPPGTAMALSDATAPEFQIVNESSVATWANWLLDHMFNGIWVSVPDKPGYKVPGLPDGIDIVPDYSTEMALVADTPALVRRLNLLLCAGQLSAATVTLIVEGLRQDRIEASASDEFKRIHVARALVFVMCSAEFLVQR